MNLNPIIGFQKGLALLGIGGFYLYKHAFEVRKPTIEGPYKIFPKISSDFVKDRQTFPSIIREIKFHFSPPVGAVKPNKGER